eukprot:CAMPEP_0206592956 /NCGR_PEP_ID=MMETSP0325_2-20121206/41307_1 /ASSEMBLY_ACC=CAM_ASM_000347 /TAXON_ID=2866 /ORGANISM="Crypthecodinium cohnii, Strain Seligo" /LENGTH=133 /DNA_ID=CAMNT_0054102765 /DNA_START=431 /DNA_END=832 /DNA_ORIENTATION=-
MRHRRLLGQGPPIQPADHFIWSEPHEPFGPHFPQRPDSALLEPPLACQRQGPRIRPRLGAPEAKLGATLRLEAWPTAPKVSAYIGARAASVALTKQRGRQPDHVILVVQVHEPPTCEERFDRQTFLAYVLPAV